MEQKPMQPNMKMRMPAVISSDKARERFSKNLVKLQKMEMKYMPMERPMEDTMKK